MPVGHSTKRQAPPKPHRDFPLFPHRNGQWCKKVRGKQHYFGVWEHPDAALELWLQQKDALLAGRTPRKSDSDEPTLADAVNHFLSYKEADVEAGDLADSTFKRYHGTCKFLIDQFGRDRLCDDIKPDDFLQLRAVMGKRWGAHALANEIQVIRMVFKHALDNHIIENAIMFGTVFAKPSKKVMRKLANAKGDRSLSQDDVKALLAESTPNMKAMILLALNAGLSNEDIAQLPISIVDLERHWISWPRTKNEIKRRFKMWPETVDAIRNALESLTEPVDPNDSKLVFIGKRGRSYAREVGKNSYRVTAEFTRVRKRANVDCTFYDCRRTFETVGGDTVDQVAVDFIMGHTPKSDDMAAVYRQKIPDERLVKVTDYVRFSLLGKEAGQ